jgi:exosortase B
MTTEPHTQPINPEREGFNLMEIVKRHLNLLLVVAIMLVLYVPTLKILNNTTWASIEQSYGPVLLAASIWLFWQKRQALDSLYPSKNAAAGFVALAIALFVYAVGRSQGVLFVEAGSVLLVSIALLLLYRGWLGVRAMWLSLVLLVFLVPIPTDLIAMLTGPMKSAVSAVAESILATANYPIARSGVILSIGPYQLLVADACAGLTSMFTLEAIGLVYMGLRSHPSAGRNLTLALLLVPIAFAANVVRVLILVLVTFYFGDEAGQGFVHSLAGILLFVVATCLMLLVDGLLGLFPWPGTPPKNTPAVAA